MTGRPTTTPQARALAVLGVFLALIPVRAAEPLHVPAHGRSERDVARSIDAALVRHGPGEGPLPALADDATFLRRASLDLTGSLPRPAELAAFLADASPDRRTRQVERFLASDAYAVNWGRYWRDVLTYHTPASGNYLRWALFDRWLVEQVRRNRPWGEVVAALVSASGVNDECPPVNFLTALYGNPVEIAATTSRVFLGVQLQCAQCHDARTEHWKREQFHQFVAFFGRTRLIQHKDVTGRGTPYAIEGRDDGQYFMTDKKDPSRLIPMSPRFLNGAAVSPEADDQQRRSALARFLISPQNPWFARAHVNRIWTALMGWGFYPGLADLGSPEPARHAEVLDLVAAEWTASGYDMRWLFRTLALTQVYQGRLSPRPTATEPAPAAVCPQRLRPEQIFETLVQALGVKESDTTIPAPAPSSAPAVSRHTGLRHMVYQAFKVDPSLPAEEVQGTIPQALVMMNSALVQGAIAARGQTYLADALTRGQSDETILRALYERTLARDPRPEELNVCRRYLERMANRHEALEDIFWSLLNSTEFLTRK